MITRLRTPERQRTFDSEIGCFVEAVAIPCHRCGICCERWQPLVSLSEQERLAAALNLAPAAFAEQFTVPYPFDDASRLLRREGSGCVFLRWEGDGRAACAVHAARPDACREWLASFARRECVDGLSRFGAAGDILPLARLYPDEEERAALCDVAAGAREYDDGG